MQPLDQVQWLGHAGFSFTDQKSGNKIYYADPYQLHPANLPKADILFITHAHPDHLSQEDIAKITKADTQIVAPQNCLNHLTWEKLLTTPVTPNNSYIINEFEFKTVPAYNIKPDRLAFHPQDNHWVGYIFYLNDQKIYHAGDTDFIPEMKELVKEQLDIAMLPIGGTYTMDVAEAIEAANAIKAKKTIPMHYKNLLGNNAGFALEQFKKGVAASEVVVLTELA